MNLNTNISADKDNNKSKIIPIAISMTSVAGMNAASYGYLKKPGITLNKVSDSFTKINNTHIDGLNKKDLEGIQKEIQKNIKTNKVVDYLTRVKETINNNKIASELVDVSDQTGKAAKKLFDKSNQILDVHKNIIGEVVHKARLKTAGVYGTIATTLVGGSFYLLLSHKDDKRK